jgi:thiol-disulfide isomerase/thioredoxin
MKPRYAIMAPAAAGLVLLAWLLCLAGCSPGKEPAANGPGDIRTLPAGEAVDLAARSAPGKVTIFDFYAEWCSPCGLITPELEKLVHRRHTEIALRKVDVIGWGSDAAVQQQIEYLPYLAVVDENGTVLAAGDESFTFLKERFGLDLVSLMLDA